MRTYAIAHEYENADGRPLLFWARFLRSGKMTHVSVRSRATLYLTRGEAEAACPRRYYVDPRAKVKKAGKKGTRREKVVVDHQEEVS